MFLPQAVQLCIQRLEEAGFAAYAVGGCVRDALLGLTPHDYDLCTGATPAQMRVLFADHTLVRSGEKHGTIGVVFGKDVIEITTFRTEGSYTDGRHPDWVRFVGNVEADLARRDFTVNAMAYSPKQGLIDPWGGQADLSKKLLRTVGTPADRFREDALRILRGVRFSVRYGLQPEADTLQAMKTLAPLLDQLARERVFEELCKLLPLVGAQDLLTYAPVLARAVPVLAPCIGFDQRSPHHRFDVFTHTAQVVENTPADLLLRWAALLHDVGKPLSFTLDENGRGHFKGHAAISAQLAEQTLLELKAPTALRDQVVTLIEKHMTKLIPDKKLLRRWLGRLGVEMLDRVLTLQEADMCGKGFGVPVEAAQFQQLRSCIDEILAEDSCFSIKDLAVNGADLLALGFAPGPRLGQALQLLLELVMDERVPNEKQALLDACKEEIL